MNRLDPTPTRPDGHPALRQAALLVLLVAATAALARTGPSIPMGAGAGRAEHWWRWVESAGPAAAVVAAVRLAALAIGAYLAAVTALAWATSVTGSHALAACARRLTVPAARCFVTAVTGAGLALTVTAGIAAPTLASAAPTTTTLAHHTLRHPDPAYASDIQHHTLRHPDPAYASDIGTGGPEPTTSLPAPTMRRLDDDPPATAPTTTVPAGSEVVPTTTEPAPPATVPVTIPMATAVPPGAPASGAAAPGAPGSPTADQTAADGQDAAPATWTIAPGDHLWRVSSRTLQARWGRSPSDSETARYLRDLIRLNRAVLAVSGDPDLVFPGQVFTLPPVPTA